MKLKNIEIATPVFLAPMAGITDKPMRDIAQSFSREIVAVSEMVPSASQVMLADAKRRRSDRSERMFEKVSGRGLTSVQIFGNDPAVMARAARINQDLGADIIDINMGCPAPKIVKNKSGAELMRDPRLAEAIIRAVRKAIEIPLTVKIRTGWDSGSVNAVEFARMVEAAGADMLTIHGRTRAQMYSGSVDLKTIAAVKKALKIPVIGNGDVVDYASAKRMLDTGVNGVMIGRAAVGAPWLPAHVLHFIKTGEELAEPSLPEKAEIIKRHIAAMIECYGEKAGVINFRKHLASYSRGLKGGADFRRMATVAGSVEEMLRLVGKYFEHK